MTETLSPSLPLSTLEVEQEITVAASRQRAFDALTSGIGRWWPHRFAEDASVTLEAHIGGRFYEERSDGGGALYCTVVAVEPPRLLRLNGPMGMRTPVCGVVTFELLDGDDGTTVRCSHRAFGEISDEARQGYTQGWAEVLAAVQRYVTG